MNIKSQVLRLIATSDGNWDYYLSKPYSDGTQALLHIAKDGSGAVSGIWCGVSDLKAHLHHLANIRHGRNWESMIPDDWTVIDKEFFLNLRIY